MRMKLWFIGGIVAIAAVAGIFEALASPGRKEEAEEKKKEGKEDLGSTVRNCCEEKLPVL